MLSAKGTFGNSIPERALNLFRIRDASFGMRASVSEPIVHQPNVTPLVQQFPHPFVEGIDLFLDSSSVEPIVNGTRIILVLDDCSEFIPFRLHDCKCRIKKFRRCDRTQFFQAIAGFLIQIQIVMIDEMPSQVIQGHAHIQFKRGRHSANAARHFLKPRKKNGVVPARIRWKQSVQFRLKQAQQVFVGFRVLQLRRSQGQASLPSI